MKIRFFSHLFFLILFTKSFPAMAMFPTQKDIEKTKNISQKKKVPDSYSRKPINVLRQEAEAGNAGAQYYLAQRYEYGDGVSQNIEEANKWYRLYEERCNDSDKEDGFFEHVKYWLTEGDQGSKGTHPPTNF